MSFVALRSNPSLNRLAASPVPETYVIKYTMTSNPAGDTLWADADYRAAMRQAVAAGVDYLSLDMPWQDIDTAGVVETYGFERMVEEANGVPLWVNLKLIDFTGTKRLPAYLAGLAFDHASVIAGVDGLLDAIFTAVPSMYGITLGTEIEAYLDANPSEITPFATLLASAKTKAQTLWGADVHVTSSFLSGPTASDPGLWHQYDAIHAVNTIPCLTYYFINGDFTIKNANPATMGQTIGDELLIFYNTVGGPYMLEEFGCNSATSLNSSEALQEACYIGAFAVFDIYRSVGVLKAVAFELQNEIPDWVLDQVGYTPGPLRDHVGSLALRRADDTPKPAWDVVVAALGGFDLIEGAPAGVSATSEAGTLSPEQTIALSGVSSTSTVGTMTGSVSGGDVTVGLTGSAGTSAVGSFANTHTYALTGTPSTATTGTVALASSLAVTGSSGTASTGAVTSTRSLPLTGTPATASTGTVSSGSDVIQALTGIAATSSTGTLALTHTEALTGAPATATAGTVTAGSDVAQALTGVSSTSTVGLLTLAHAQTLTGSGGTASTGTLADTHTQALTGLSGTASVGTFGVTKSGTVALTGVQGISAVGNVSAGADITQALTGVSVVSARGTLTAVRESTIAGASITALTGTLGRSLTLALTGVSGTTALGLAVSNAIAPTPDVRMVVRADDYVMQVPADDRRVQVPADDMLMLVG